MPVRRIFLLLLFALHSFCEVPFLEKIKQKGFVEIADQKPPAAMLDALYSQFDALIEFLQTNPIWAQKLYIAKEHFVRSPLCKYYSTDFFGLYEESNREGKSQISFYYSTHFHAFISSRYPEFTRLPEIRPFLDTCLEIQKPYGSLLHQVAASFDLETLVCEAPPILFKVVKYFPAYIATKPHYDGTAFSLFLDSTDDASLLLSPYKSSFTIADFSSPPREFSHSILLIPGAHLAEFSIHPTPHIVLRPGKTRYAAIAFAMRPNYTSPKIKHAPLPIFNIE
ncbi:MAG TPA: hypothetical protein VHL30_00860 [Chlamydiales bacterium]|nr:hypothetical protein [Chlamydiales bacterium]